MANTLKRAKKPEKPCPKTPKGVYCPVCKNAIICAHNKADTMARDWK